MSSIFSMFLSPVGLILLAAFDSSVAFFLPLANDVAIVYLAAGDPGRFWLYPVLATVGSMAGCATTYWLGTRVGDEGLAKWIPERRLDRVRTKVKEAGAVALAVPALIPPPFPYTPFVLASGALEVDAWTFFGALGVMRFARFFAEAWLAHIYGKRLLAWMNSTPFRIVIWGLIVLAVVGTAWSVYQLVQKTRGGGGVRRAAA